jgi:hypothetical protein
MFSFLLEGGHKEQMDYFRRSHSTSDGNLHWGTVSITHFIEQAEQIGALKEATSKLDKSIKVGCSSIRHLTIFVKSYL